VCDPAADDLRIAAVGFENTAHLFADFLVAALVEDKD